MKPSEVKSLLARHGLLARRDLGQNFLVDDSLAKKLVRLSGVGPGESVLEIGTGLGLLTRSLAECAERVVSLEIDAGLVRLLQAEGLPENVELRHEDALQVDLRKLVEELGPRVRVVANLPYSISSPLLRRLLDLRTELLDWSVMLQSQVASRLLAEPGGRGYGSLTALHALVVDIRRCLDLHPRCFYPVPRVDSTFLRISPISDRRISAPEFEWAERVLRAGFGRRRKTLRNALRGADLTNAPGGVEAVLEGQGIDPRARAESLLPEQWLELSRALRAPSPELR